MAGLFSLRMRKPVAGIEPASGLTGRILAFAGLQNLAEDHFVDFTHCHARALQNRRNDRRPELMGRRVGEGSIEGSDRGAAGAGDDDGRGAHMCFLSSDNLAVGLGTRPGARTARAWRFSRNQNWQSEG